MSIPSSSPWRAYDWQLIQSAPIHPVMHMALDEALLEEVAAGRRKPTLRIWEPSRLARRLSRSERSTTTTGIIPSGLALLDNCAGKLNPNAHIVGQLRYLPFVIACVAPCPESVEVGGESKQSPLPKMFPESSVVFRACLRREPERVLRIVSGAAERSVVGTADSGTLGGFLGIARRLHSRQRFRQL